MNSIITKIIDIRKLAKSIKIALKGLLFALKKEQTFRIQVAAGILAIFLTLYLDLSVTEKALIYLAIAGVLGMELINTQIEKVLDFMQPTPHPHVKSIKDLSAAAVLIMALGSLILGIIIFLPKILKIFNQ
ncbi:diacylglycerol kinase family protein [bacterium]|nr:diacylglycerol kinase family protein [bacterium]